MAHLDGKGGWHVSNDGNELQGGIFTKPQHDVRTTGAVCVPTPQQKSPKKGGGATSPRPMTPRTHAPRWPSRNSGRSAIQRSGPRREGDQGWGGGGGAPPPSRGGSPEIVRGDRALRRDARPGRPLPPVRCRSRRGTATRGSLPRDTALRGRRADGDGRRADGDRGVWGGGGTTPPGPPLVLVRCGRFHPYLYMSVCHYGYKEIINDYPYLYRVLYSVQVTGTGYLVRMYHGSLNAGTDRRNETGR